jgi:truncated hemoglobin YjbI
MGEPSLYERLGGIFAIAAVIDNFSDRLVRNQTIVDANPELHEWHTVSYKTRLPGLKWGRTWWVATVSGGPYLYTGKGMRDAHYDLKISPEVFDVVSGELAAAMDDFSCQSARRAKSWVPLVQRRGKSRPAPSLAPSTGEPGIEPGLIGNRTRPKAPANTTVPSPPHLSSPRPGGDTRAANPTSGT